MKMVSPCGIVPHLSAPSTPHAAGTAVRHVVRPVAHAVRHRHHVWHAAHQVKHWVQSGCHLAPDFAAALLLAALPPATPPPATTPPAITAPAPPAAPDASPFDPWIANQSPADSPQAFDPWFVNPAPASTDSPTIDAALTATPWFGASPVFSPFPPAGYTLSLGPTVPRQSSNPGDPSGDPTPIDPGKVDDPGVPTVLTPVGDPDDLHPHPTPVPEPSSAAVFGFGLIGLLLKQAGRRRGATARPRPD
jgi:hypothetical protein